MEPARETHFTTVEEEQRRKVQAPRNEWWSTAVQVGATLMLLVGLLWGGWWLMKPSTADQLYDRIRSGVEDSGGKARAVESELDEFAERFPDDPRLAKLKSYYDELEMDRAQRQLRVRMRLAGAGGVSPVGRLFAAAMDEAEADPSGALAKLQSLVELYGRQEAINDTAIRTGAVDAAGDDQKWIELARRQIATLEARLQEEAEQYLPEIQKRLAEAEQMEATQRDRAGRVYRAIIELYGGKTWAEGVVSEAQERLGRLEGD